MKNDADNLLLQQLKSGDITAYESLFKKYYKLLNIEALLLLADQMEAEDQVQLLFIELWNKKLYLNIRSSVKGYLRTSIRNRCLNVIEKWKTEERKLGNAFAANHDWIEADLEEEHETEQEFDAFLETLPPQRLQAFYLVYIDKKRYKDAADVMGITINSIKTHLKLAVKDLRRKFINYR
ncbi:RNA polymerase sigma factor [Parapedobacter lycopersici]|uniref:RNA polymerase sigma factor n=1 Tax=Parapedobacter lycopersici TaxID=1864939 RepID=UPI00214D3636|nr:sigma-70 family RNA polymerase sigma factor [Parapedobacter lycopersici]